MPNLLLLSLVVTLTKSFTRVMGNNIPGRCKAFQVIKHFCPVCFLRDSFTARKWEGAASCELNATLYFVLQLLYRTTDTDIPFLFFVEQSC